MRNRWFHRPTLHTAHHEEKKVSWLELFYDLVFVAAIIQLGDALSNEVTIQHAVMAPLAKFAFLFTPLWLAWTGFTFFANRFDVDDFLQRGLVFSSMFAVATMAIASSEAFAGQLVVFALSFSLAQFLIFIMHLRAYFQVPDAKDYALYWGAVFLAGSIIWGISAFTSETVSYVLWGIGIAAIITSPMSRFSRELAQTYPIDFEHLGERYGLLTIIVLGESFVKVLSYLSSAETGTDLDYLFKGFLGLAITCSLWWIYFDDIAGSEIREARGSWIAWLFGHLPLTMMITAVGVAVKKTITFDFSLPPDVAYRWLLAGAVAAVFFSVAVIDSVTERKQQELSDTWRVNLRFATGVIVILLAQIGTAMSAGTYMAIITAVVFAQVIFDMMMAPLSEDHHLHATSTADIAKLKASGERMEKRPARDLSEAVRKGTPSELRRDLFFFFMEGTWTRLLFTVLFLYIVGNVVFAGLYLLEPGSIDGDGSFSSAFNFSVQTMSTIGYGALTPNTPYGNLLVTIEAAVGILGAAMVTGLMFAKASRASSSVVFSNVATVTTRNGKPTLMFRVGNARGNEVVEAQISVSVLVDEITPEGHHIRAIKTLDLIRERTPIFTLSWSVMHVIDENSPLVNVDWSDPGAEIIAIIVTLMGHDPTYAQMTHARHLYRPDAVLKDYRFVDVISELDDGRLMIDFEKFHDVYPESPLGEEE